MSDVLIKGVELCFPKPGKGVLDRRIVVRDAEYRHGLPHRFALRLRAATAPTRQVVLEAARGRRLFLIEISDRAQALRITFKYFQERIGNEFRLIPEIGIAPKGSLILVIPVRERESSS